MKNILIPILAMLLMTSCQEEAWKVELKDSIVENPVTQSELDNNFLVDTLLKIGQPVQLLESGAFLIIDDKGTGDAVAADDILNVKFTSKTTDANIPGRENETVMDLSKDDFIKEAFTKLNYGGKCQLFVSLTTLRGQEPPQILPFSKSIMILELKPISKIDMAKQMAEEKALMDAYIAEKGLEMEMTESGIYYKIVREGTGDSPTAQNSVLAHYEGTLLNGSKFDSSYDRGEPVEFSLTQVVKGWQEGIPLMKEGGEAIFVIPSNLAYGARSTPTIPANSSLVFKVELVEITK